VKKTAWNINSYQLHAAEKRKGNRFSFVLFGDARVVGSSDKSMALQ
jgi:hypothetical protein